MNFSPVSFILTKESQILSVAWAHSFVDDFVGAFC